MRAVALTCVLAFLTAGAAHAQTRDHEGRSATKALVGTGAIVLGAIIAAKSSDSTTITSGAGVTTTSSFSATQLGIGLGMAGVGGFLLWDGLRTHPDRYPSTAVGVSVGKRTGLFVRKRW